MKKLLYILLALTLLPACSKQAQDVEKLNGTAMDMSGKMTQAIVTVKQDAEGVVFFQLDEKTQLYPVNYAQPYEGLKRIICGLSLDKEKKRCYIHWMDEIERGDAATLTSETGPLMDSQSAGLDVLDDWMTSVEDGFLTVHYSAWWGEGKVPHTLRLYRSSGEENTFELTLLHFNNGDEALEKLDALVYFDIDPLLAPTQGEYKTLTIKWTTLEGKAASKEFKYRSRQ